jgi:hypothetical protein
MKKIINGKKYDTETAEYISFGQWRVNSVNHNQKETLYKKKTGEYFLFHEKRTTWGNIYDYEDIEPISLEYAKTWVEKHDNEHYETIFGEVEE